MKTRRSSRLHARSAHMHAHTRGVSTRVQRERVAVAVGSVWDDWETGSRNGELRDRALEERAVAPGPLRHAPPCGRPRCHQGGLDASLSPPPPPSSRWRRLLLPGWPLSAIPPHPGHPKRQARAPRTSPGGWLRPALAPDCRCLMLLNKS